MNKLRRRLKGNSQKYLKLRGKERENTEKKERKTDHKWRTAKSRSGIERCTAVAMFFAIMVRA